MKKIRSKILTAQHSTAQHSTAQNSTAQHSTLDRRLNFDSRQAFFDELGAILCRS